MFRFLVLCLIYVGIGLQAPCSAQPAETGPSGKEAFTFYQPPDYPHLGPEHARGAFVWLHGSYDSSLPKPPVPSWANRMVKLGYDIFRFDRDPDRSGLQAIALPLVDRLGSLRSKGYRRVVVAAHSSGARIETIVLAEPGAADAVALISPASHGPNPAQRAKAMADWAGVTSAAAAVGMRVALVQMRDDPLDLDPPETLRLTRDACLRVGMKFLSIYQPASPTGHMSVYDPDFDPKLGEQLATFLDGSDSRSTEAWKAGPPQ